jgi:uroporphyrinogen III methyltransferase/synthase
MKKYGKVYLIGGGPGDPGLITVKGKEILGKADAVVHDYLVNPELLSYTKPGAELICVGKKAGHKVMPQGRINELLVEKARGGRIVARLKGGDPFIFGRGGEEAEVLAAEGIEFEIVPGVTSASAVPAYAGIPLTHRKIASSFAVVTGHENPAKGESGIEWDTVARMGTVVFLMGREHAEAHRFGNEPRYAGRGDLARNLSLAVDCDGHSRRHCRKGSR